MIGRAWLALSLFFEGNKYRPMHGLFFCTQLALVLYFMEFTN
jgi:hypothetical protein